MTIYDLSERLNWKQACEVLGCGKSTLYRLVREGKILSYGVGKRGLWFRRNDCEKILRQENSNPVHLDKLTY